MGLWTNLEEWLERTTDRFFRGNDRRGVQPLAMARGISRLLETTKRVSISRTYAANYYKIWLNPQEFRDLAPFRPSLAEELEQYIQQRAERSDYLFLGPIHIEWAEDEELLYGRFRLSAEFLNSEPEARPSSDTAPHPAPVTLGEQAKTEAAQAHTQVFRPVLPVQAGNSDGSHGELQILNGQQKGRSYRVPAGGLAIGRDEGNEVVLPDPNVSRRHATIRMVDGKMTLRDENSTNGTLVNGVKVKEKVLMDGDHIRLGLTEIRYRVG